MLVILTAVAYGAGQLERSQSYRLKRDKEEELLFRGLEYLRAIRAFRSASATEKRYPRTLDELVSDPRTNGRRFIRQLYKDPMTGRDFGLILTKDRTISGVVSSSKDIPLRMVDFDKDLEGFDNASSYAGWRFEAKEHSPAATAPAPAAAAPPAQAEQPSVPFAPVPGHYR